MFNEQQRIRIKIIIKTIAIWKFQNYTVLVFLWLSWKNENYNTNTNILPCDVKQFKK